MLLYIDASAVSIIIPAIAGVLVGVGSWLFLRFRRAKSKVSKKLGIDENAGKEVEEDVVIIDEENAEEQPEETEKAESEEEKKD